MAVPSVGPIARSLRKVLTAAFMTEVGRFFSGPTDIRRCDGAKPSGGAGIARGRSWFKTTMRAQTTSRFRAC
ncbi:MAG TPA: hypothetical protein VGG33_28640, partial [Polyangia bacterium]